MSVLMKLIYFEHFYKDLQLYKLLLQPVWPENQCLIKYYYIYTI